jgi:hypothetical protein
MHGKLSQILEREVVGELIPIDSSLRAGPWGRLLLKRLARDSVESLLERLRQHDMLVRVTRPLVLERGYGIRGLVEVEVSPDERGEPYWLQITQAEVIEIYEHRFWLAPATTADLMGCYVEGVRRLRGPTAEPAFSRVARLDMIEEELDAAIDAALEGSPKPKAVESLMEQLRSAVDLLPWSRRRKLSTRWLPPPTGGVDLAGSTARVRIVTVAQDDGRCEHDEHYVQGPQEDSEQLMTRVSHVFRTLNERFPPPGYLCIAAQTSSAKGLLAHFPRYQPPLGQSPEA